MAALSKAKEKNLDTELILDTKPLQVEPQEEKLSTRQEKREGSRSNEVIGKNLAKFRNEAGMTRQELANKLSLTASGIGYFETGRKIISARYIAKLMKLFNKNIQDFLVNQ